MSRHTGQTLAQKLIARASGQARVAVGEVVTCKVDLAMFHDSSGPRRLQPMLQELGAQIWDTSKVVLVLDHYVPAQDADARKIIQITRDVAKQWRLPHVIDSEGICHVVLPERGHLKPGFFGVGGDSHSPTGGAFGRDGDGRNLGPSAAHPAHAMAGGLAKRCVRQRHDASHGGSLWHERGCLPSG